MTVSSLFLHHPSYLREAKEVTYRNESYFNERGLVFMLAWRNKMIGLITGVISGCEGAERKQGALRKR